jgi:hypothetical protein
MVGGRIRAPRVPRRSPWKPTRMRRNSGRIVTTRQPSSVPPARPGDSTAHWRPCLVVAATKPMGGRCVCRPHPLQVPSNVGSCNVLIEHRTLPVVLDVMRILTSKQQRQPPIETVLDQSIQPAGSPSSTVPYAVEAGANNVPPFFSLSGTSLRAGRRYRSPRTWASVSIGRAIGRVR